MNILISLSFQTNIRITDKKDLHAVMGQISLFWPFGLE